MFGLSGERIQQIWDYELISAWDERGRVKMWLVINRFIDRINPDAKIRAFDLPFEDKIDLLDHLELKRCLDIDYKKGIHTFQAFKSDVIGFIHARSEGLSMALINGEMKPLILLDIDSYKWTKSNLHAGAKASQSRYYQKKKDKANRVVGARNLSGSHSWDKVK